MKSSGSIFIAFKMAIIIRLIIDFNLINLIGSIIGIAIIYFFAIEYLLSKYRSRNIRMYINYLIGDNQKG